MKRRKIISESSLNRLVSKAMKQVIKEGFEDDYNNVRDKVGNRGGMWGFEMKNPEGDWEYGDITYDPKSQTMTCMGVTIDVDPDMTVDQNLEALYDELMNQGYYND